MSVAVGLSPSPILQFFNNQGQPNAGGSVLTQVGGVDYPTYQDSGGVTALPNPIPLNSRGEISDAAGTSCQLFLEQGVTYTFTLYDANNNQLNQATFMQSAEGNGIVVADNVGGTANAITCAYSTGSTINDNQVLLLTPISTNTGNTTVNGITVYNGGSACVGGEAVAGVPMLLEYSSAVSGFQLFGNPRIVLDLRKFLPYGGSDWTTAFTNALAEASAIQSSGVGGAKIWVPGSSTAYSVDPSAFLLDFNNIIMDGDGVFASIIQAATTPPAGQNGFVKFLNSARHNIRNVQFDANGHCANTFEFEAQVSNACGSALFNQVYLTGATTDTVALDAAGGGSSDDVSSITFFASSLRSNNPSNSQYKCNAANGLSNRLIACNVGGPGSSPFNFDMQTGQVHIYDSLLLSASAYDIQAAAGQVCLHGGRSESAALLHTLSTDSSGYTEAPHVIDGGTQGSNSGTYSVYHEATRVLQLGPAQFSQNVRTGPNAVTVRSGAVTFSSGKSFVDDSGGWRVPRWPYAEVVAYQSANAANQTGDGTAATVIFDTATKNVASYYNATTGEFTAPVDGNYRFTVTIDLQSLGNGHTTGYPEIAIAGGLDWSPIFLNPYAMSASGEATLNFSAVIKLTAAQVATIIMSVSGSTKTVTIGGGSSGTASSLCIELID